MKNVEGGIAMKRTRKYLQNGCAILMAGILILSTMIFAGCGGKNMKGSKYLGKWNAVSAEMSGMEFAVSDFMDEFSFVFKEDGTCEAHIDDEVEKGKWEETETGVKIKDSTDTMDLTDKDGDLYIEYEGVSFRFEKEGSEGVSSGSSSKSVSKIVTESTSSQSVTAADSTSAGVSGPQSEADGSRDTSGTHLEMKLWDIYYPEGWTENEDYKGDSETSSYGQLDYKQGDTVLAAVNISATVEDCNDYRDFLHTSGIDAHALAVDKTVEQKSIGGVPCVFSETTSWGEPVLTYMGRDVGSGTTVKVSITGEYSDPAVEKLISNLAFHLKDTGNEDYPWPWEGEAFTTDHEHSKMIADTTITSVWVPVEEPLLAHDIFSGRMAAVGDRVFILLDNVLYEYTLGDSLTLKNTMKLEDDYEELSADQNGNLYLTGFMSPMLTVKDGQIIAANDDIDKSVIHSSGTWGLSWFFGSEPEKVVFDGSKASKEAWSGFSNESINTVSLSENHIFIAGEDPDTQNEAIWVLDTEGNQQMELGNQEFGGEQSLGSITDIQETEKGFIGLDGNMRNLLFWKSDGSFLGSAEDSELFGTNYPWISAAARLSDGTVLVGMTEDRADNSATEFIVYRVSGF